MAKVYVTGANGQLGQCLQSLRPEFTYLDSKKLDLSQPDKIQSFFQKDPADWIIHCAAYTQVDKAESEPELAAAINATASSELAKSCKNIIYISTDYVYADTDQKPRQVTDETQPVNIYGKTKLLGEQMVQAENPNHWIIRTSWLFSEFGNNFVKSMLRLGKEKEALSIVNDQYGSPTYAMDLAHTICKIFDNSIPAGVYNFSNSEITNWHDFAEEIFRQENISIQLKAIPTSDYPTPAKRPYYSAMNLDATTAALGSIRTWKEALSECLTKIKEQ